MITFSVPGLPVAQPRQRHRVVQTGGRAFATNYTPKNDPVQAFKASVRMAAADAYQGPPLQGPLSLEVTFVFPRPKSMIKKKGDMPRAWKQSKPDWDNLGKAVCDALNGQVWGDDAQVARVLIQKVIAAGHEQPYTRVSITEAQGGAA